MGVRVYMTLYITELCRIRVLTLPQIWTERIVNVPQNKTYHVSTREAIAVTATISKR